MDELAVLVHKMMEMENINVMFAMVEMEGRIYLVARSRLPQVDVSEIARLFGGGGHAAAAAASIKNMTLTQVEDGLFRFLNAALGPVRTAKDIMAYPVISMRPDGSLNDARKLLVRYDINVLLVTGEDGSIKGFISMQNVEKALLHGLTSYPVKEFMTSEFETVGPEATFREIQVLIVEQKQRILPVVRDGIAVGVITRTDLLNILASETQVPGSLIEEAADTKTGRDQAHPEPAARTPAPPHYRPAGRTRPHRRSTRLRGPMPWAVFVRDIFLRQDNLDIDVVIEGDANRFADVFAQHHSDVRVRHHRKFKTAVLIFSDDLKIDVTTARIEYYDAPGALPVVRQGSIRMDLYRRDFSINTLAVSLSEEQFGTVIDYFRGLKDIKDGYVRVLHNLSFVEDPTRVFRAIRFEQRFGFKIGKLTQTLIQNAVKHDFFLKLSGKRLFSEIDQILQEEEPAPAVARLAEFDLLKFIHPDLTFDKRRRDLFARIKKVRDWFDLTFLSEEYRPSLVYLLGILDGLDYQDIAETCVRLSMLKYEKKILAEEKPLADRALGRLYRKKDPTPSEIHRVLSQLSTESLLFIMAKTQREGIARSVSQYLTKLKHIRTELDGEDLIAMGLEPGPRFKNILTELLHARLNGEVKSRQDEEAFITEHYL